MTELDWARLSILESIKELKEKYGDDTFML